MVNPAVEVIGGAALRRALKGASDEATGDLKALHKAAADIVAVDAKRHVPVRSGRLQKTLKAFGSASIGRVKIGSKAVPYAGAIHWGWPSRNITKNPFLTDALDSKSGEVLTMYSKGLDQILRKHGLD